MTRNLVEPGRGSDRKVRRMCDDDVDEYYYLLAGPYPQSRFVEPGCGTTRALTSIPSPLLL